MAWQNLSEEIEEELISYAGVYDRSGGEGLVAGGFEILRTRPDGLNERVRGVLPQRKEWTLHSLSEELGLPWTWQVSRWLGFILKESAWLGTREFLRPEYARKVYRPGRVLESVRAAQVRHAALTRTEWLLADLCSVLGWANTASSRQSAAVYLRRLGFKPQRDSKVQRSSGRIFRLQLKDNTRKATDKAGVVSALLAGASQVTTARVFGVSAATVCKIAKAHGLSGKKRACDTAQVLGMRARGMKLREIAARLGVSRGAVDVALRPQAMNKQQTQPSPENCTQS